MRFLPYSNSLHKHKIKRDINKLKILEVAFVLIFVTMFSGMLYENISGHKAQLSIKNKGKMVTIEGSKLNYNIIGRGKYTFILESDMGTTSLEWSKLVKEFPKEMKDIKMFTYDRAGYGLSEATTRERTPKQEAKDLYSLFQKSGLKGPYILVGHSYGAIINSNFVEEYPEEVAGMILIDPISEKQLQDSEFKKDISKKKNIKSLQKISSNVGAVRFLDKLNIISIEKEYLDMLPEECSKIFKDNSVGKKHLDAYYRELKALTEYKNATQKENLLGEKPLIILASKSKGLTEEEEKKRMEYNEELLKLSTKSEMVIVDSDIKNIPLEENSYIYSSMKTILKKVGKPNEK